jgi:hypothetical protein
MVALKRAIKSSFGLIPNAAISATLRLLDFSICAPSCSRQRVK